MSFSGWGFGLEIFYNPFWGPSLGSWLWRISGFGNPIYEEDQFYILPGGEYGDRDG